MKKTMKKFPLLICLIVSCAIIVASLFVAGFAGIKIAPSLGGGSQFEVVVHDSANTETTVKSIKNALAECELSFDSATVEDKFVALDGEGTYTKRVVIVKILESDISDEREAEVIKHVAWVAGVPESKVSSIENIVSSIKSSDVLYLGLGIGIIALCLFAFGWIRYDIFAGLSFILSYLHNIILFLSVLIITRLPLSLVAIAGIMILTLVMTALVVSIYEKNKVESEMHLTEKETISQRMIRSEVYAMKPFALVGAVALVASALLLLVPVMSITLSSFALMIAVVCSGYTGLLVGPAVYTAFLEIKNAYTEATLSRNDTVNKEIKKKIAKSKKASESK